MHAAAIELIRQATTQSDRELVDDYIATKSEESFAELVSRHSRMVKRVAADVAPDAADDIVQATFVLFQRKINSVAGRESAAGWLCLTSRRLALKARSTTTRRRIREEKSASRERTIDPADELSLREVRSLVVQELNALPDSLRIPLLVCYWDGDTQHEAARRLGCSLSTLKRRLESARSKLEARLKRRGFGPTVLLTTLSVLSASSVRSQAVTLSKSLSPFAQQLLQSPAWLSFAGPLAATVMIIVSGAGLQLTVSAKGDPQTGQPVVHQPRDTVSKERVITDSVGDSLPSGAVARFGTARLRPGMNTTALSFDPSGKSLFSYSHEYQNASRFSIWDVATGKELQRVEVPEIALKTYRWTPGGRGVAVVQTGRDEHWLWNVTDKQSSAPKQKDKLHTAGIDPGEIITAAISPDGKRVAAGRYNGLCLRAPAAAGNPPATVSFSVWDAETNQPLQSQTPLWTHERNDDCIGLAFSPDGRELVGVFLENMPRTVTGKPRIDAFATVMRWDAANGKVLGSFPIPNPMRKPHNATRHTFNRQLPVAFSPKDNAIAIGADDGIVHYWSRTEGRETRTMEFDKKGAIDWLEFNADGSRLAAVVCDGDWYSATATTSFCHAPLWSRFEIRDAGSGDVKNKWDVKLEIDASAASDDGKTAAFVGQSMEIEVYDTKTTTRVLNRFALLNDSTAIAFNSDGSRALIAGRDTPFQTWDVNSGRLLSTVPNPKADSSLFIHSLAPDRKSAYAITNRAVSVIEIASGAVTPLAEPVESPDYYTILGTSSTGVVAVAKMNDQGGAIQFVDREKREVGPGIELPKRTGEFCNPHFAEWTNDGNTIVLGGNFTFEWKPPQNQAGWEKLILNTRGWLATFDAKTGRPLALWMGKTFYPARMHRLNHPSAFIVVGQVDDNYVDGKLPFRQQGSRDNSQSIQLFDLETLHPIRNFELAPGFNPTAGRGIGASAVSNDGKMLAVSGPLNDIFIYEIATGRIRKRIAGHNGGQIGLLAFDPTGRRLISTGADRTALVWDVTIADGTVPVSANAAWKDLLNHDAKKAYAAERYFLDHPAEAVATIRAQIKPAVAIAAEKVNAWIAALDANDFDEREAASKLLLEHADQIRSILLEVNKRTAIPEVKKRLATILDSSDESRVIEGPRLLNIRAVEILERLATTEALAQLKTLASGAARSALARDAAAALARIEARMTVP